MGAFDDKNRPVGYGVYNRQNGLSRKGSFVNGVFVPGVKTKRPTHVHSVPSPAQDVNAAEEANQDVDSGIGCPRLVDHDIATAEEVQPQISPPVEPEPENWQASPPAASENISESESGATAPLENEDETVGPDQRGLNVSMQSPSRESSARDQNESSEVLASDKLREELSVADRGVSESAPQQDTDVDPLPSKDLLSAESNDKLSVSGAEELGEVPVNV